MNEPGRTESTHCLCAIAHARSGDKGNHANIGVIAWTETGYRFLDEFLTAERVAEYFAALAPAKVERFAMPGIRAFNFLLHDVLQGGASGSLLSDSQGKTLAHALLQMPIDVPADAADLKRN